MKFGSRIETMEIISLKSKIWECAGRVRGVGAQYTLTTQPLHIPERKAYGIPLGPSFKWNHIKLGLDNCILYCAF